MVSFAAERLGKHVGVIAQCFRRLLNSRFRLRRNIARKWGIVQDNGNSAGRETAGPGYIANSHRGFIHVTFQVSPGLNKDQKIASQP